MSYTLEIQTRFSDTDAYGHVNSVAFFSYMEAARFHFFKEHLTNSIDENTIFFIVKAECEYKNQIDIYKDRIFVDVSVTDIGNSSFTLSYTIHNKEGKIFAYGKTVLATLDSRNKRKINVPDKIKALKE